jgi:hypothetical protein
MKKILLSLGLITLLGIPALSANALLPPQMPKPIDNSKVIFDPSIKPILDPIADPQIIVPYIPLPMPDIEIPPSLLLGPTITDIKMATNVNSALIEWTTNRPATSKIEYGTSATYQKSLEDKGLVTDHALAIPANTGELHIRISSDDSLGRHSESKDILVLIPETPEPTLFDEATSTDATNETDEPVKIEIINSTDTSDSDTKKPILEVNGIEPTEKESGNLSATNAILGGVALLLAGVLIGVLVKTRKKE